MGKQDYVLSPTLFNLFINDVASHLADSHRPNLEFLFVPLLCYVDDGAIHFRSQLLSSCVESLERNNFQLSTCQMFGKSRKLFNWNIVGNIIEQVNQFKYLGVLFHYKSSWIPQCRAIRDNAKNKSQATICVFL